MSPTVLLRVGLIVNPIAGLGGAAGLKGSDGHWQEALDRGFEPTAPERARRFVAAVGGEVAWLTVPGAMGVPGLPVAEAPETSMGHTDADDTKRLARLLAPHVDLLCFVGGDGTAADVANAGISVPCLGIPGGVKITSPVFAHDPEEAAWLIDSLLPGFETIDRDVTDLDEEAYRAGRVDVVLKGSLKVPMSPAVQGSKVPTSGDTPLEPLVEQALRDWETDALHLMGAGSVMRALKQQFWGKPTLLGVDAIDGDRIVATDLDAHALEALTEGRDVHLWLSIIGGQGMLLGRGTQILSPTVLKRIGWDRIHVVAPPEKLLGLRALHIDSGDAEFDAAAPKHIRVISGWNEWRLLRVQHGHA